MHFFNFVNTLAAFYPRIEAAFVAAKPVVTEIVAIIKDVETEVKALTGATAASK